MREVASKLRKGKSENLGLLVEQKLMPYVFTASLSLAEIPNPKLTTILGSTKRQGFFES